MNRLWSVIVVGCMVGGVASGAQAQRRDTPPAAEVSETGAETYTSHCASCHGRDGKGDGPIAPSLRQKPADLTTITRRRGTFPRSEMSDFILGRGKRIGAHGTRDMPVWGPLFKEMNPFDSRVDVRVERLLDYIQSLQVK